MSTAPVPGHTQPNPPATLGGTPTILPLIEMLANTALTVLSISGVTPANSAVLAAALESAINPLIQGIQSGQSKTSDVIAGYGAMIGVLNSLKQNPALPADVLSKVDAYMVAAQNATTGYLAASQGFENVDLTPVTPMK